MRTHLGAEDDAFGCMGNGEDAEGGRGVFLRRNVIAVAGRALKANLQRLGPLVLPVSELVRPATPAPAFRPMCVGCCGTAAGQRRSPASAAALAYCCTQAWCLEPTGGERLCGQPGALDRRDTGLQAGRCRALVQGARPAGGDQPGRPLADAQSPDLERCARCR